MEEQLVYSPSPHWCLEMCGYVYSWCHESLPWASQRSWLLWKGSPQSHGLWWVYQRERAICIRFLYLTIVVGLLSEEHSWGPQKQHLRRQVHRVVGHLRGGPSSTCRVLQTREEHDQEPQGCKEALLPVVAREWRGFQSIASFPTEDQRRLDPWKQWQSWTPACAIPLPFCASWTMASLVELPKVILNIPRVTFHGMKCIPSWCPYGLPLWFYSLGSSTSSSYFNDQLRIYVLHLIYSSWGYRVSW